MGEFSCIVDNVVKEYPRHRALAGVTLAVPAGACVALLGHNGAGKTTLLKLLLGLTRPSSGSVRVLERDPASADSSLRQQIGFLPESVSFYDEMSGEDTLCYLARLKRVDRRQCALLLEQVGLSAAANRRVKTYSKGMRQRLGLAQALLGKPRLLLLDEPTTGLDPILRQEFYRMILALRGEGVTILLSSHLLTELEARTDLAIILRQGRLAALGSLEQLREQAKLPVLLRVTTSDVQELSTRLSGSLIVQREEQALQLAVAVEDKMPLLRYLLSLADWVSDVEIQLPTLDDLYRHFGHLQEEEGSQ
ncbi:ABC transporter ATP-binding protein [Candidatus Magnetaquicoccus inordinatus]|uniref:ABC transporter ATP-binding protein n=1 Tax=Candidatus Magnetaquicoccus inordinatus TaxID=2496818 RepID=UPI00102B5BAD|nr:ABC transporter ATP-binding protein [Candidatus Magnetaquicoccus inordinatus]